jgi:hypothetical protein
MRTGEIRIFSVHVIIDRRSGEPANEESPAERQAEGTYKKNIAFFHIRFYF